MRLKDQARPEGVAFLPLQSAASSLLRDRVDDYERVGVRCALSRCSLSYPLATDSRRHISRTSLASLYAGEDRDHDDHDFSSAPTLSEGRKDPWSAIAVA